MRWNPIIILFVLLGVVAYGQDRVTEVQYGGGIANAIVREYSYPATVSYVETSSEHHFAYADASMQVINSQIPSTLYVLDMEVHGGFVYFCGYDNAGPTVGVWGWFKVADLMSGALTYHTYDGFQQSPLYADTLHDLVVFEDNGETHVALVGAVTDGQSKRHWCSVDVIGTEGSPSGWSYTIGVSDYADWEAERRTRICVTDNFVVTAGTTVPPSYCETLRIHRRSGMFMTGGHQDTVYMYTFFWDGVEHSHPVLAITNTDGDMVATASKGGYYSPYIVVNVYDMMSLTTTANPLQVYNYTVYILPNIIDSIYIRDIRYSANAQELHLLLTGEYPGLSHGSFLAELPLPPAPFNCSFVKGRTLLSLDNYNGQSSSLAIGYKDSDNSLLDYYTQTLSSTPLCAKSIPTGCSPTNYRAKSFFSPYTVTDGQFDCTTNQQLNVQSLPNAVICE